MARTWFAGVGRRFVPVRRRRRSPPQRARAARRGYRGRGRRWVSELSNAITRIRSTQGEHIGDAVPLPSGPAGSVVPQSALGTARQKAIKRAIDAIEGADGETGDELRSAVVTGYLCRCTPRYSSQTVCGQERSSDTVADHSRLRA